MKYKNAQSTFACIYIYSLTVYSYVFLGDLLCIPFKDKQNTLNYLVQFIPQILLFLEKTLINCLYFAKQRKYSTPLSAKLHSFYLSSHCLKSSYPVCLISQLSCIKMDLCSQNTNNWHISLCILFLYFVLKCNIKLLSY